MENFYQYIDKALPDKHGDKILYKFKKETIDAMSQRANELTARGLKDKAVISDLIISENEDIVNTYKAYAAEKKAKARKKHFIIGNVLGSFTYVAMLLVCFFGISMSTGAWNQTWVILVDGTLLLMSYLLTLGVNSVIKMRRIFHIIARVLLATNVMIMTVALFIFMMAILHIPKSWIILFGGLLAMFVADGTFASATKQRLAVINWLVYIPIISTMAFVIIGALALLKWSVAWLIIPAALFIDLLIIIISMNKNSKYDDEEVVDTWQEN